MHARRLGGFVDSPCSLLIIRLIDDATVRIVASIPGDPGQRILNCLHRERRRAEGIFIQRERRMRPAAGAVAKLVDAATVPMITPSCSVQPHRTVSVFRMADIRRWSQATACDLVAFGDHAVPY